MLAGTGAFDGDAGSGFGVLVCGGVGAFGAGFSCKAEAVATGTGFACRTADGFRGVFAIWRAGCGDLSGCTDVGGGCCLDEAGAVLTGVLNGVLKRSNPLILE